MKKYRSQKFGLNPEWVRQKVILILTAIIIGLGIMLVMRIVNEHQERVYASEMAELEEKIRIANEESESREREREKQEQIEYQKRIEESIKAAEIEKNKANALYENEVSKKVCPVGTYLKNIETKKVGRVIRYYGLRVVTDADWWFDITNTGEIPKEIQVIGWREYSETMKKQIEKAGDQQEEMSRNYHDEYVRQTYITKSMFPDHTFVIYKNKKYSVKGWEGGNVVLKPKNRKEETIRVFREEPMKKISYIEFEKENE